jgi:hypothetical protein
VDNGARRKTDAKQGHNEAHEKSFHFDSPTTMVAATVVTVARQFNRHASPPSRSTQAELGARLGPGFVAPHERSDMRGYLARWNPDFA